MSDYRIDISICITRVDDGMELYDKHTSYTISGEIKSLDDLVAEMQEIGWVNGFKYHSILHYNGCYDLSHRIYDLWYV